MIFPETEPSEVGANVTSKFWLAPAATIIGYEAVGFGVIV
jgi:hypothetical protein